MKTKRIKESETNINKLESSSEVLRRIPKGSKKRSHLSSKVSVKGEYFEKGGSSTDEN